MLQPSRYAPLLVNRPVGGPSQRIPSLSGPRPLIPRDPSSPGAGNSLKDRRAQPRRRDLSRPPARNIQLPCRTHLSEIVRSPLRLGNGDPSGTEYELPCWSSELAAIF